MRTLKKCSIMLLCMVMLVTPFQAFAQTPEEISESLNPIMDLVTAASFSSYPTPEVISTETEYLSSAFVASFFKVGVNNGSFDVSILTDLAQQANYLAGIFVPASLNLVALEAYTQEMPFTGFHPVSSIILENGNLQIVGEIYQASKHIDLLSDDEQLQITWLDRGVFEFVKDSTATFGYKVISFFNGASAEAFSTFEDYFTETVVEYVSSLGFSVLYPALFEDSLIKEDAEGFSATLPDNSASIFVKKTMNTDNDSIDSYTNKIASTLNNPIVTITPELLSSTISHQTDDGYIEFNVYIISNGSIYHAQLRYLQTLSDEYAMFTEYLNNSFVVHEVSQG